MSSEEPDFEAFLALPSDEERGRAFQAFALPYREMPVFCARLKEMFLQAHPNCGPPERVQIASYGFGVTAILVDVKVGEKKRVPRTFLGCHVKRRNVAGNSLGK